MVIDASVAVAIALGEHGGPVAAGLLAEQVRSGGRNVVPSHFWLEVANAVVRGHRRGTAEAFEAIYAVDRLELETVDLDRPVLLSAIDFAERLGLTSYDATYLALAHAIDGSLLTFDRALQTAAGARGVPLEGRHRLSEAPAAYEHQVTWPDYKGASAYLAKLRVEAREAAS
jgi:predicted nucleic acid-binding protein